MFELKQLSADAIPAALDKALRYRLLNDPAEAESICHDVLRIDPENQLGLGESPAGADRSLWRRLRGRSYPGPGGSVSSS